MNLSPSQIHEISSTPLTALGQMGQFNGKIYRYVKAGAANLAPGKLVVQADPIANHVDCAAYAAAAINATKVQLTLGATAATADYYRGGQLVVQDGTGEGRAYEIEGNTAADASGVVTVYLREGLSVAIVATTSKCDLIANRYQGVVISATDQADLAIGIPNVTITAAYYGWVQTFGACSALMDEAVAAGLALTIGTGVAGAVEALDGAGEQEVGVIGSTAGVDTEYQLIYLTIDKGFAA
jgi:hypothetical protein